VAPQACPVLDIFCGIKYEISQKIEAECHSDINNSKFKMFAHQVNKDLNAVWKN